MDDVEVPEGECAARGVWSGGKQQPPWELISSHLLLLFSWAGPLHKDPAEKEIPMEPKQ